MSVLEQVQIIPSSLNAGKVRYVTYLTATAITISVGSRTIAYVLSCAGFMSSCVGYCVQKLGGRGLSPCVSNLGGALAPIAPLPPVPTPMDYETCEMSGFAYELRGQ